MISREKFDEIYNKSINVRKKKINQFDYWIPPYPDRDYMYAALKEALEQEYRKLYRRYMQKEG